MIRSAPFCRGGNLRMKPFAWVLCPEKSGPAIAVSSSNSPAANTKPSRKAFFRLDSGAVRARELMAEFRAHSG